jgi:hypothetical protein
LVVGSTAIATAPWTAAAATSCSGGIGEVEIVGELSRLDGGTATFRVENASFRHSSPGTPLPATGSSVAVFFDDDVQFLREGERYDVQLWWYDRRFISSVTTADDTCGVQTRLADGSSIETSLLSRSDIKQRLLVTAIAFVAFVVLPAIWIGYRRRQRQRRNDASLRAAAE